MKAILNRLFENETLSREEAREILMGLASDRFNPSQAASFLTVFRLRSITVQELQGFQEAMLDLCTAVDLSDFDPIDVCGTGGDNKDTFNISTLSAFVVAGCGIKVAKHGNHGVSSICGSSTVLEKAGVAFLTDPSLIRKAIEKAGICFLHAPLFHPAMKQLGPIRRDLGVRTFLNMLGPLVNPAKVQKQLIGVYDLEILRLYTYLHQAQRKQYCIIHSLDGYDEISLTSPFKVSSSLEDRIFYPEDLGFQKVAPGAISGGTTAEAQLKIFLTILGGDGTKDQEDVVISNAAFGIRCAKPELSLNEAISMARESLTSKLALKAFQALSAIKEKR